MKKQPSALIANLLNKKSQPMPTAQEGEAIVMRDARKILVNPKNERYSMESIEELAAMIQLTHNIEPVTVKELPDGTYMLTSGHRRRLAQLYRFEHGMVESPMIPCITKAIVNDFSEIISDDEMETLNVVFPNKGQRRHLSPSEEAAEIEMIRPILYKIYEHEKAAGNVQGKFRTFFAEVLGMSETTLQRKESISKVSEKIKEAVDAGHIKPTAAAALANMGAEEQNHIVQSIKDKGKEVTVEAVKQAKQEMTESTEEPEPIVPAVEECTECESVGSSSAEDSNESDDIGMESDVTKEAHAWLYGRIKYILQEEECWLAHLKRNKRIEEIPLSEEIVRMLHDTKKFIESMEVSK